jgi:steroid delta-isomerase-like uncharacterized protein
MPQDNKALARRWFDEVWNARREDVIHQLAHPDVVTHGIGENNVTGGIEQFLPFWRRFLDTFPDLKITVEDVLAEADKTAVRLVAEGTHTGAAMGVPPTQKRVRMTGLILIRWQDGQIIEAWNEFDAWGMMQQIAAPPQNLKIKQ